MKIKPTANKILMGLMVTSPISFADDSFYRALSEGQFKLDTRLRYESSQEDNTKKDATGLTLRTRLGYETSTLFNTKAYIEMSHNTAIAGVDNFNPINQAYSTIADPEITRLNQAYLKTSPIEGLQATAGRQRIILDNARFVGNVGWRQTEQVFDAMRIEYSLAHFTADISYLWGIKGITDKDTFTREAEDILINLSYTTEAGKISGYHYINDDTTGKLKLDTSGIRFSGKKKFGDFGINYQAEYAMQKDAVNNKEADYTHGVFGGIYKSVGLSSGYEKLGSDGGVYGFNTPLATKHAYNGWADIFLGTPAQGLNDVYFKASVTALGIKAAAIYHIYTSVEDNIDYGSELDIVLIKPFAKKYKIGLKYANYAADAFGNDTEKLWAFAEMKI